MQPLIVRAAASIVRDAAEDVAQKVFAALLENDRKLLRTFQGRSSLSTWLIGITRHQALSTLRREKARDLPTPPAAAPGPLEQLLHAESQAQVTAALDALPPRERLILMLHYRDGLPYAEIAAFLGVTPNSVSPLLERARNRFKANM